MSGLFAVGSANAFLHRQGDRRVGKRDSSRTALSLQAPATATLHMTNAHGPRGYGRLVGAPLLARTRKPFADKRGSVITNAKDPATEAEDEANRRRAEEAGDAGGDSDKWCVCFSDSVPPTARVDPCNEHPSDRLVLFKCRCARSFFLKSLLPETWDGFDPASKCPVSLSWGQTAQMSASGTQRILEL